MTYEMKLVMTDEKDGTTVHGRPIFGGIGGLEVNHKEISLTVCSGQFRPRVLIQIPLVYHKEPKEGIRF